MGAVTGRRQFGLFTNGMAQDGTDSNFSTYNYTNEDSLSGDGCFVLDYNLYGNSILGNEFVPVDPENNYYQISVSLKTKTNNYLGNPGSGFLGFACYDKDFNFISHHQAFCYRYAKLTREASPGDTTIYIDRGDWPNNTTNHVRSINFYFAGSPYPTVGGYSRYNLYNPGYNLNGITQISASEWSVSLAKALPNWGYSYSVGTDVGQTQSGGTFNYALGAPQYPSTWTTYVSNVMNGYVIGGASSGANFRDQTKYIKFMNLANYNFRLQRDGDSARYYLDNIMLITTKKPLSSGDRTYRKLFEIDRFKTPKRNGQKRSDFF